MNKKPQLNEGFSIYLFIYLLVSIITVLVIRFYLTLTNFPQLSGGDLHIAHLLWGGLLMLSALIIIIVFKPFPRFYLLIAILTGVGFGIFWDEIGKIISLDNNYFFKPALPIIYLTFIIQFFLFLFLTKLDPKGQEQVKKLTSNSKFDTKFVQIILVIMSVIRLLILSATIGVDLANDVQLSYLLLLIFEVIVYLGVFISLLKPIKKTFRDILVLLLLFHFIIIGSVLLYFNQFNNIGLLLFELILMLLYILHTN